MAKKQTRRTVSMTRAIYDNAKEEATRRGMTLAALVEAGLAALGVPIAAHPQQTLELAQANAARRAERAAGRRDGKRAKRAPRRPSRERQLLGDQAADAYGFA